MVKIRFYLSWVVLLLCNLIASAHNFEVGGIYYTITSSANLTVKVTYRGNYFDSSFNEYSGAVTVPETVTYNNNTYSVTSIGSSAFYNCSRLTAITLPESVTSIGNYAFYKCSGLTTITIPESVTSIGEYAFEGCSSLTSITIPESVTSIGEYAFSGCSSLTAIIVDENNLVYDSRENCNAIIETSSNTLIQGCSATLIPESVTSIGSSAFYNCSNLTSITIPEGVTSIGNSAFYGCSSLYKVINYSNLSLSKGSSSNGYVAYYAKVVYQGSELTTVGDYQFYTSNGIHSLVNYIGNDTEIVLPDSYNGENYKIGDCAFRGCSSLTSITIPESVTSIGDNAFRGCSSLYSVTIGSGVLSIGSNAFSTPKKVIWLTNTPPTGYTNTNGSINYVANDQYTSLNNVRVYPYLSSMFEVDGVKYVPVSPSERTCDAIDCAYNSTAAAINVSETASFKGIAMTVKEVMPYTFYGNKHIKEVNISHKGNIGNYAFYDCDSVQSVELYNEGYVGSQAFYDCDGIKSLDISNVGYVSDEAFRSCGALETAIVANSPKEADSTTPTPQPITFADWVSTNHSDGSTSSETYTFTAAEGAALSFNWSVSSEASYDKLIVTLDGTTILEKSGSTSGTYNNAIAQGEHTLVVKYTKDGSQSSGSDQASVSNIVVSAGSSGTTGLDGAVYNSVFYDCVSLKSATLGDKVTSLGNDAFRGCTSLQEIVIPNSVKWVGTYCFYGCTVMKSAVIGDGLTNVKEYTFANCGLEKIIIGDNITSIGNYAFKECRGMKSAVLGNGLTKVNGTMFNGCIGLENVEIGNKVTELEANAFQGCSSLPTITIPQAVTKIGDNVFVGCSKLADVIIADRTEPLALGSNGSSPLFVDCPLDSVYIGGKITYSTTSSKGYSPFYRNTSLRTVVITDREEQIYANEFYGCTNLQNVTIGNGVKSIGNYAFSGCSSLEGFSFGNSMESVGDEAFSDCTNLTSLTSYAAVPPTCGSQALDDINKWNCTLYIPTGSLAAYMAADQWKEFFFIEDNVTDGIEDIIMNDKQIEIIYDLQGRRVLNTDNLKGIYIINGKKTIK